MHTVTFENQLFFNKTYEPNFNLPQDLANQFSKFHASHELTGEKKFALLANFFCWQCYSCKVVRLGLRNFSLEQTKVTLVS